MGRHRVVPKHSAKPLLASLASVSLIAGSFTYFTAAPPVPPTVISAAIIPAPIETTTLPPTTTEMTLAPVVDQTTVPQTSEPKPPDATTRPPTRLAAPSSPTVVVETSTAIPPAPTTTHAPTPAPRIAVTTPPPPPPSPKTTPKPPPPPPAPTTSVEPRGDDAPFRSVADIAKSYVGTGIPYVYGGKSLTSGADCSYFVTAVLNKAGIKTPYRSSSGFADWTTRVKNPQPGDLVLFSGHIGIYTGNGMMVDHGSGLGAKLREIKWFDDFIGYGRIPV